MMSIDIAVIDIKSAISAMNSRNGSGNRTAVASGVGGFKCAYMHYCSRAGGSHAAAQCVARIGG